MKHTALISLFVFLIMSSCRQQVYENIYKIEDPKTGRIIEKPPVKDIVVDEMVSTKKLGDPYEVLEVVVIQDTLELAIRYGGGCEEHHFKLVSKGAYAESDPPQLSLYLFHDGNKDKCRSMLFKTLRYDLRKIRYPGSNKVVLQVSGAPEPVTYTY